MSEQRWSGNADRRSGDPLGSDPVAGGAPQQAPAMPAWPQAKGGRRSVDGAQPTTSAALSPSESRDHHSESCVSPSPRRGGRVCKHPNVVPPLDPCLCVPPSMRWMRSVLARRRSPESSSNLPHTASPGSEGLTGQRVDSRLRLGWPRWLPAEHSARHSPRNNLTSTTERATRSSWIWQ